MAYGFSIKLFKLYVFLSFIDNLDRIAAQGYIPSPQDVLQVRFPTTGIIDHCFTLETITLRYSNEQPSPLKGLFTQK